MLREWLVFGGYGLMTRANRYLMFYLIVAVGLAVSWMQLGRNTLVKPDHDLSLMQLDDDCRPWQAPCAAYADEFALILGPDSGAALQLRGQKLPAEAEMHFQHFDAGKEQETPEVEQFSALHWRLPSLPELGRLRVSILWQKLQWTAEFPLSKQPDQ